MFLLDATVDPELDFNFIGPLFSGVVTLAYLVLSKEGTRRAAIIINVIALGVMGVGWYVYARTQQGSRFFVHWPLIFSTIMTILPWAVLVFWFRRQLVADTSALRCELHAMKSHVDNASRSTSNLVDGLVTWPEFSIRLGPSRLASSVADGGVKHELLVMSALQSREGCIVTKIWLEWGPSEGPRVVQKSIDPVIETGPIPVGLYPADTGMYFLIDPTDRAGIGRIVVLADGTPYRSDWFKPILR